MHKKQRVIAFSASSIMGGADYILHTIINQIPIEYAILNSTLEPHVKLNKQTYFHRFIPIQKKITTVISFFLSLPKSLRLLGKLIESGDTILCNDFQALIYVAPFALTKKIKIVYHCHAAFKTSMVNKLIVSSFINLFADKIIVPSVFLRNELMAIGIKKELIKVIYNGLPSYQIKPSRMDSKELRIGVFGGITEQKGQDIFIDALIICMERYKMNVMGYVVGEVYDAPFYSQISQRTQSIAQIKLTGFLNYESTQELMTTMDIVVCPSKYRETLPTVLIEALRAGIPIVGSDTGGIPEIIIDQVNGILVKPNDAESLAKAIYELADKSLREQLGMNGHDFFESKFRLPLFIENVNQELFD